MPGLVALVRPDGRLEAVSPLWQERLGTVPDAQPAGGLIEALRAGRQEGTMTAPLNGAPHPVRWSGREVRGDGAGVGWLVLLEALPAAAEGRFRGIFNTTFEFIGLLSRDGTVLEANEAALRFGGLTREAVVGRRVWETHWF